MVAKCKCQRLAARHSDNRRVLHCQPSSVRHDGKLSTRFLTTSGVRQGCVLAPALFCVAIDWILNHMDANPGIRVGSSSFTDLVYDDE